MFALLTQFGDSSSGIGALGVDGKALIIQLISFGLAFLVLKRWAFGPIVRLMDQRRQTIESGVKLGEDMKKQQAELDAKVANVLKDARQEADNIITAAHDTAREQIAATEAKARKKAEDVLSEAEERIKQDTARARRKLESELVGLVSDATEAIIGEKIDPQKDARLIDKALRDSA